MATQKKMSAREYEARKKRKVVVFAIEIVVILIMVGVLWAVMTTSNSGPNVTVIDQENLGIHSKVQEEKDAGESVLLGYMNVALFGVDATKDRELFKDSRSDATMIASINLDTGDIKLVSVYRDTYLNNGNDKYEKCNAAYFRGGAEQALKMLNMNLDMDIETFVTVGYKGLSKVIDGLGGVWIDIDSEELEHINNYQMGIAENLKCDYIPVKNTGYQLLNGVQATAYCRIRYTTGNDFKRTARQREVLMAMEDAAKKADLATLTKVFNDCIGDIYTNIDSDKILELLKNIGNYHIVEEDGFPQESMRTVANIGSGNSCVVPLDLEENVVWLHEFLFNDQDYAVTDTVKEINKVVKSNTSKYINTK